MFANLVVDLLVAQIGHDLKTGSLELRSRFLCIFIGIRRDGCNNHLYRRKPERHVTGKILDQNAEETFHRAADGAMDHDRLLLFRIRADIEGAEAFRQVEIDLRGAALPFTADGVLQRIFKLRPVERTLARQNAGLDIVRLLPDLLQNGHHHAFGTIPKLIRANALFRARRELDGDFLEAEILIDRQDKIIDAQAFRRHLLFGAENMRIVLRETAHTHQPVQRTGRLIAVHIAEFRKLYRKIAV
ncbi:Uncharacterised protein [Brucella neotomae]|nr:Uncharacterised protein [Brucella neotomae]